MCQERITTVNSLESTPLSFANLYTTSLKPEIHYFYLKLFKVVYSDSDPNWLLFEMVNTSISTTNSLTAKGIDEAKNLIDNAVQKCLK